MKLINNKTLDLSIIDFNMLGFFNFDSLHGFIISRNIKKRFSKAAEYIRKQNPDIITFQEVHTYYLLSFLKKKMPAYTNIIYKPFIFGPRGGLVIFSKLPVEEHNFINFTKRGTFKNKSFITRLIKNGLLACKLKDYPLYILNTHLTPNPDFNWFDDGKFCPYINAQLEQVGKITKELSDKGNEIIAAGDYNTSKGSSIYKNFIRRTKLKDVFEDHSFPTFHQEYLTKNKLSDRIDYIFLFNKFSKMLIRSKDHLFTNKVKLDNGRTTYLSDHIGLKADLTIIFKN